MTTPTAIYHSLRDRRVLVTGGASGIGASIVAHFADQGAIVGFLDMDEAAAQTLRGQLPADAKTEAEIVDLRDIAAMRAGIASLQRRLGGGFEVLVNNAARDDRHTLQEVSPEYWDDRMNTNLRHQFFAIQAVRDGMAAAGGGSIINMSSNAAMVGAPGMPVYTAAKTAVIGLTRSLARELGPHRIRVNAIFPGWIMTDRQLSLWMSEDGERFRQQAQCLPDRLFPADVARMALWLASDESRMITARDFFVDGGWL